MLLIATTPNLKTLSKKLQLRKNTAESWSPRGRATQLPTSYKMVTVILQSRSSESSEGKTGGLRTEAVDVTYASNPAKNTLSSHGFNKNVSDIHNPGRIADQPMKVSYNKNTYILKSVKMFKNQPLKRLFHMHLKYWSKHTLNHDKKNYWVPVVFIRSPFSR